MGEEVANYFDSSFPNQEGSLRVSNLSSPTLPSFESENIYRIRTIVSLY